jgi:hypothetical protein
MPTAVVGASGAIFGLMGSLIIWIVLNRQHIGPIPSRWLRQLMIVLVINVVFSALPGISAAAHFGGGIAGVVLAVVLYEHRFGRGLRRWLAFAGVPAFFLLSVGAVVAEVKWNPAWDPLDWEAARLPESLPFREQAARIEREKVIPAIRPSLRVHTLDEVRDVVGALRDEVALLDKAIASLQSGRPYSDRATEEKRQQEIARLEAAKEHDEDRVFAKLIVPLVTDVEREALTTYREAEKLLLYLDPPARDPASVKDTVDHFHELRTEIAAVIEVLQAAGTFARDHREEVCQMSALMLAAESKLFELAGQRLAKGKAWTSEEEKQLDQQVQQVNELRAQWRKLTRG